MQVVVAPDSFGGTLSARDAARAIADGWSAARPGDELVLVPLADGGEGTLDVVSRPDDERREVEVANPVGRPVMAEWILRPDGSAVIESARACGLALLRPAERVPLATSTYGVGQLLEDARRAGATRLAVGMGGSATVDGGAGALLALGFRLRRADGNGVKISGGELGEIATIERTWVDPGWDAVDVDVWADVDTALPDAAAVYGPQKGATPEAVRVLAANLERWAEVVERHLGGRWRHTPGSGAAGGVAFGLTAGLGARVVPGAAAVAAAVGFDDALARAEVVVTGEGRLDATSTAGKVVGHILREATPRAVPVVAVCGQVAERLEGLLDAEAAAPDGPGDDPAGEVAAAAQRLARRLWR